MSDGKLAAAPQPDAAEGQQPSRSEEFFAGRELPDDHPEAIQRRAAQQADGLVERINNYLRQLSPHMNDRQGNVLLREAARALSDRREAEQRMSVALERIARWQGEFPDSGMKWSDGSPMSYAAAFGRNGERDYMRQVAADALNPKNEAERAAAAKGGER